MLFDYLPFANSLCPLIVAYSLAITKLLNSFHSPVRARKTQYVLYITVPQKVIAHIHVASVITVAASYSVGYQHIFHVH